MVRAGSFSALLSVSPAAEPRGRTVILGRQRQPAGGDGPPCEGMLLSVAGLGVQQRGTYLFPNPRAWTWCHRRLRTGYCFWRNVFLLAQTMVSMVRRRASPLREGCAWHPHKPSVTGLRRIQSRTNPQVSAAPGHGCCILGSFYHACSRGCRLFSFTT